MASYPPGTCGTCQTPMDLALKEAGLKAHPLCSDPERRIAKDGCDVAGCTDPGPVWRFPHGDYDMTHARMMAPRRQWPDLGIPVDKPEPETGPEKAAAPQQAAMELEAG